MVTRPSRRALLLGALATGVLGATGTGLVAAVETGALPGRLRVHDLLGIGEVTGQLPAGEPAPLQRFSFVSTARRQTVNWLVASPAGASLRGLPVVLVLHGRGGTARSAFTTIGLSHFLAAHVRAGGPPLAVVSVDGGETPIGIRDTTTIPWAWSSASCSPASATSGPT